MLRIINKLEPFLKDNYRRINVREYARLVKISPPSASKFLSEFNKEGLLKQEVERNYIFYSANQRSKLFIRLARIYWEDQFNRVGLIESINKELLNPTVILFGSFSKAEIKDNSDIDIAIFTHSKKKLDFKAFEKRLKRSIQVFIFKNKEDVKSKELLNNILNGTILSGGW